MDNVTDNNNFDTEYMQYDTTCADCAYHHCTQKCKGGNKCKCGDCLYLGVRKRCYDKRCEHFKAWKRDENFEA